ncbi:MAG TPA: hypothetical protein VJW20_01260 [Candidatus Angelobacter sp.]|nr:hypothetical protein [Candidatus Angelobacter sp.]
MIRPRIAFSLLACVLLVATGETCGPEFAGLVFTRPHGPDSPIPDFTRGNVGVPLPGWWRAYLVVAYRYLEGKPLSKSEGTSFTYFWGAEHSFGFYDPVDQAIDQWEKERAQYASRRVTDNLKAYRADRFSAHLNCAASAFMTAVETLEDRARRFGPASKELSEWIAAQDAVFSSCQGESVYPPDLPANANALLRADRDYQIAAAHFYSTDYKGAIAAFDKIGRDAHSPWRSIAPYLAARALVRQSGTDDAEQRDTAVLRQADQRLQAILKDTTQAKWHQAARKLANLIAFHLEPLQYQHRLAREIAKGGTGELFGQDVRDYTLLLDKYLDEEPDFPGIERYEPAYDRKLRQWRQEQYGKRREDRTDDLTDWLMTFQSDSSAARMHAISKWRATGALPWLFITISKSHGTDAGIAQAIEATAKIPPNSPVFVALSYHRARLLQEQGDTVTSREALAQILDRKQGLSLSTLNLVKDEQMKLGPDPKSFIEQLARKPVRLSYDWYDEDEGYCYDTLCKITFYGIANPSQHSPLVQQFSPAAALLLNTRIPTQELAAIVNQKALPAALQRRLATAVWARAILLGQAQEAAEIADSVTATAPELKRFIQEYSAAKSPEERRFVAAFAVAHFPGLRPFVDSVFPRITAFATADNYRDNWWCSDVGEITNQPNYDKQWQDRTGLKVRDLPAPAFLTAEQQQQGRTEWDSLRRIGAAENYLPRTVIEWARAHPDDPRVPEGLHFAWRVAHYACSQEGTPDHHYSYQAFKLLHKKYPKSEWTQKTKTWP